MHYVGADPRVRPICKFHRRTPVSAPYANSTGGPPCPPHINDIFPLLFSKEGSGVDLNQKPLLSEGFISKTPPFFKGGDRGGFNHKPLLSEGFITPPCQGRCPKGGGFYFSTAAWAAANLAIGTR